MPKCVFRIIIYVSTTLLVLSNIFGIINLTPVESELIFWCWFLCEMVPFIPWIGKKFSRWNSQRKSLKAEAETSQRILKEERLSL